MGFSLKKKTEVKGETLKEVSKKEDKKSSFFSMKKQKKEEYTVLGKKKEVEKKEEKKPSNKSLIDLITPYGVRFKRIDTYFGENVGAIHGAVKYASEVEHGWLSKITNLASTVFSLDFDSVPDSEQLVDNINASLKQVNIMYEESNDPLEKQRLKVKKENGEKLMERIDQHNEKVGLIKTIIMPYAPNEDGLKKEVEKLKLKATKKMAVRKLAFKQEEAYKQISPFHREKNEVTNSLERLCPLSSVLGGFPFSASGFSDGTGYYFARDMNAGLVILNLWKREGDRTNSNFVLTGVPGVGKSTAGKHIVVSEFMKNTKEIIIDPEGEYRGLVERLGGEVINAGGGKAFRINPLQIRPVPKSLEDEMDEESEKDRLPDLAAYLNVLETFFRIYLKPTKVEMALLNEIILKLYEKFGITWDTDITKLSNEDFPILSDLYNLILEREQQEQERDIKKTLMKLKLLLQDAVHGKDKFLWNGHSTVTKDSQIICFDTSGLGSMSAETKTAQYFNITNFCWQLMSRDKEERVLLVCDEAYLLIDPEVPQTLSFIRDVEKRARKYNAAIGIISHSVVDFLDEKVKRFGQAVLDLPAYKFIMGTDGQNLKETAELYSLNEAEKLFLEAKQRKKALAFIGSKRIPISFDIPGYKFEYFGTAGGQ